jgi:hypothetical protein
MKNDEMNNENEPLSVNQKSEDFFVFVIKSFVII